MRGNLSREIGRKIPARVSRRRGASAIIIIIIIIIMITMITIIDIITIIIINNVIIMLCMVYDYSLLILLLWLALSFNNKWLCLSYAQSTY